MTSKRPSRSTRLERIGRAIANDRPIDWPAETDGEPELSGAMHRLRQIEALRNAHRVIAESAPQDESSPEPLFHWGPLHVLERIGLGSFGEVYRALDSRLQREVALKLRRVDPDASSQSNRRFLEEARHLARVRHSNVLVVHGAGIHNGRAGFWTDFIRGQPLAEYLETHGPLGFEEAARIGMSICRALTAVHYASLLHGDIKAANVLREHSGRILLADFGSVSHPPGGPTAGDTMIFGSPLVLAPEVLRGNAPDTRADLYSVGVLLFHMVTGVYPVDAEDLQGLIDRHARGERQPLRHLRPDLPTAFTGVVERALAMPSLRFASAIELEWALRAIVSPASVGDDEPQTLRDLLEELGRLPDEMCRRIGREIARELQRVHALHGPWTARQDLNPDRVHLRPDGGIELVPAPTPRSPRPCTTQDDLRAVAALLRVLSGSSPSRLSPFLDRLIDELAKETPAVATMTGHPPGPHDGRRFGDTPRTRIRTAAQLVAVLDQAEEGPWWKEQEPAPGPAPGAPSHITRRLLPRETDLYGRESELKSLLDAYAHAHFGEGRVLLIEGEAGIGKSRLVDELLATLRDRNESANVLHGSYPPGGASTAMSAFLSAYRDFLGEGGDLEESLHTHLSAAPLLIPGFAAFLQGETTSPQPNVLAKDALQLAFALVTRSLAAVRTTIVVIDDLHFAPEDGLGLFASLTVALAGDPVLLIGASRPELPQDWVAGLLRHEHCSALGLPRLGPTHVRRILAETLASESAADALAPLLTARSDGNPLFLFENLRALIDAQCVRQSPEGTWVVDPFPKRLPVPRSIEHLIRARVAALDEEDRELLDVASCAGFTFDPILVAAVVGRKPIDALRRFARIEARHRLIRTAGRHYQFDHHQVQEALYSGIFEQLRELYHAELAGTLARREGADQIDPAELDGTLAFTLCNHYFRGGHGRDALRYLARSITHLGTAQAAATLELLDRALDVPGLVSGSERLELLAQKAQPLILLGRLAEERATMEEVLRLAEADGAPTHRCRARFLLAYLETRTGRIDRARSLAEEMVALARNASDLPMEARGCQSLGTIALHMGRCEEALPHLTRALELARRTADRQLESQLTNQLGTTNHGMRRFEAARESFETAIELCRSLGSIPGETHAIGNLGAVFLHSGRYDQALPVIEKHLQLSCDTGMRWGEAFATGNLGWLQVIRGRTAEGIPLLERQLRISRDIGYRVPETEGLCHLGDTYELLGRFDESLACYTQCLETARDIQNGWAEGSAHIGIGRFAATRGDAELAQRAFAEATRIWSDIQSTSELGEAPYYLGALFASSGRPDEAVPLLAQALAHAREFQSSRFFVLALAHLAPLPEGDLPAALEAFEAAQSRLSHGDRIEARYLLWKATHDRLHLEAAHGLIQDLWAHAPVTDGDAPPGHPLHHDIERAWRSNPPLQAPGS